MNKKISLIIVMLIVVQLMLPAVKVFAKVDVTTDEDISLNIELKRDTVETDKINIIATDGRYNITDLKYVNKRIELSNINYFESNNSDVIAFSITPAKTIKQSFKMATYGTYTVYAKNEHGDRFLSRITINDPGNAPDLTVTPDKENPYILNIQAISKTSKIVTLKIAKKESYDEKIDFTKDGTNIEFISSNNVNVKYDKITTAGIYEIYAADANNNSSRTTLYISDKTTPINVVIEQNGERGLSIHAIDDICKITKIKVAPKSEINDFDDFKNKGTTLNFTPSKDVKLQYTATKDDTYVFYFEDEMGYKKMVEKRITTEKPMKITIEQNRTNPKELTITATNSLCKIKEMKIAIGENISIDYFKNQGEVISITPSQVVKVKYNLQKNSTINVYIKDEQGYSYMYKKAIIGIEEPELLPPTIELSQNQESPKQIDVVVRDVDSYIRRIKWAEGIRDVSYFANSGTQIGNDTIGKLVKTNFNISKVGDYTVYAEDNDGNKVVKTIKINNIEETPEIDNIKPTITGVENNKIYKVAVTPIAKDEHLKQVILKKNGNVVNNYQNGTSITEEGNYTIIAIDESSNETIVNFMIDKMAPNLKVSQAKPENKQVLVSVTMQDNLSGVKTLKVAAGKQNIEYFVNNGQEIQLQGTDIKQGEFLITENGTYTLYVKDVAGNEAIQTIQITTIDKEEPSPEPEPEEDKTAPTITVNATYKKEENKVEVNVTVQDEKSQIKQAKLAVGNQKLEYFKNNGEELPLVKKDKSATTMFYVLENGEYTIYAKDSNDNEAIKTIKITQIKEETTDPDQKPDEKPEPEKDKTPPTITGVKQDEVYDKDVTPIIKDDNLEKVLVYKDGKLLNDYKLGDTLKENGNYTIIASDKAGNKTTIEFKIQKKNEKPEDGGNQGGNNQNDQGGNNQNQGGNNQNGNQQNNSQNSNNTSKPGQNENLAGGVLPQTGEEMVAMIAICASIIIAIISYVKYRKINKM